MLKTCHLFHHDSEEVILGSLSTWLSRSFSRSKKETETTKEL